MPRAYTVRASDEEIEANLTSMLDVIFLILAFFVVTFHPPEPERNFDVTLPPPKLEKEGQSQSELPTEELELFEDVTITLGSSAEGRLAGIRLNDRPIDGGAGALSRELRATVGAIGGATGTTLEAATIVAPANLKYRYLIAIIDACYRAGIKKINFSQPPAA